jgi:hypothetical protein
LDPALACLPLHRDAKGNFVSGSGTLDVDRDGIRMTAGKSVWKCYWAEIKQAEIINFSRVHRSFFNSDGEMFGIRIALKSGMVMQGIAPAQFGLSLQALLDIIHAGMREWSDKEPSAAIKDAIAKRQAANVKLGAALIAGVLLIGVIALLPFHL